jgi:uncharacterized protein YgbK (DUF1537 family)
VDALTNEDLAAIAAGIAGERLITGGSGIGQALPGVWRERGWMQSREATGGKRLGGNRRVLLLAGSCSAATLEQVEVYRTGGSPVAAVNVEALMGDAPTERERLLEAALGGLKKSGHCLIYSSAPPESREQTLRRIAGAGQRVEQVAPAIEELMGALAVELVRQAGVRRIVAAGGETSGAVLDALGVQAVEILDELDPGVPALRSLDDPPFGLALKSGNFGSADFLVKAARRLENL